MIVNDPTGARSFAASLHMLADIAEGNADAAKDQRVSDAYTDAATALMDAAARLREAADDHDGVWQLPLPRSVRVIPIEGAAKC